MTDQPRVYHFNDKNRPADAVYIGRAMPRQGLEDSRWRNVYKITRQKNGENVEATSRYWAIEHFRIYALDMLHSIPDWLDPLVGHDLVCWCAPKGHPLTADDPLVCHGQVLLRLIREREG